MRLRGIQEHPQQGQGDGEKHRGQHVEIEYTRGGHQGEGQFAPAGGRQFPQRGKIDQPEAGNRDDGGQDRGRQRGQRRGAIEEEHQHGGGSDDADKLGPAAHGIVYRGARIGAGDREALHQPGGDIARAKGDQFLVGVNGIAVAAGETFGREDAAGETDQGDGCRIPEKGLETRGIEGGQMQGRQSGRDRAQYRDAVGLQLQQAHRENTQCRDQEGGGQPWRPSFQGEQEAQGGNTEHQRGQVGCTDFLGKFDQFSPEEFGFALVAKEFGELAGENDQGDAVEVADKNGVREKIGNEPEPAQAKDDIEDAGDQGEGDHQLHVAVRIPGGQRAEGGGDHEAGGRVRTGDQLAR